jgi:hypothetical protein
MGKLCAPVRDEKIRELTQTQGVVPVFKGILEVSHPEETCENDKVTF